MRTGLVIEIEELVFDTLALRAHALQAGLAAEGITAAFALVQEAHRGVSARMALARIPAASALDAVGESLTLRRAADAVEGSIERAPPTFDPRVRDALAVLSSEFPIAVVTRATRDTAHRLLEQAGLDQCLNAVRSIGETLPDEQPSVWLDAVARLRADRGVAIAPGPMLLAARAAGLRTVQLGGQPGAGVDAALISLDTLDAAFVASLF